MKPRAVCLDVMGTLFDLSAARDRLQALGAPAATLEAWFGRLLHAAAALTLIGEYRPFPELAKPVLESLLAQLDIDPEGAGEVLETLAELDAYPDAGAALERLAEGGVRLVALTNGTEQNTKTLLARAGLDRYVERVIPTDAVGRYKPHPAVYRHATRGPRLGRDRRAGRGPRRRLGQPARTALAVAAARATRGGRPEPGGRPHPRLLTGFRT